MDPVKTGNTSCRDETETEKWTEVDRHLKSVKARLRANAVARDFPQLVEQTENYILLTGKEPSPVERIPEELQSPRSYNYNIR